MHDDGTLNLYSFNGSINSSALKNLIFQTPCYWPSISDWSETARCTLIATVT